tara:strand:+ start:805 stop:1188 length:384 start_codon:yes stop_codon:yes gene_type:complete
MKSDLSLAEVRVILADLGEEIERLIAIVTEVSGGAFEQSDFARDEVIQFKRKLQSDYEDLRKAARRGKASRPVIYYLITALGTALQKLHRRAGPHPGKAWLPPMRDAVSEISYQMDRLDREETRPAA